MIEDIKTPSILFAGELKELQEYSSVFGNSEFAHAKTMEDAIKFANSTKYDIIILVLGSFEPSLEKHIQKLALNNNFARVILLARMYEEPLALRIINSEEIHNLSCEYHIIPLNPEEFRSILFIKEIKYSSPSDPEIFANKDARIRMLEKLATEDDLTGIKNRRYIREFLNQIIEKSKKNDMQVTLLLFDIDDFKHYNDTYGHHVGDEILIQASKLMRMSCRTQDVVARIGGDEFAVVFWDCSSDNTHKNDDRRASEAKHPTEALQIAKRYLSILNQADFSVLGKKGKGKLTVSGGLATYPKDGLTVSELFKQADNALLEAKREGKNRIYLVGKPQEQ